jgi:hypothetical protein
MGPYLGVLGHIAGGSAGGFIGRKLGRLIGGIKGESIGEGVGAGLGSVAGGVIGSAAPTFRKGGRIKRTGKATLHKGEFILPKGVPPTKSQIKKVRKRGGRV